MNQEQEKVQKEAEEFFENLFEMCRDYYLSDYVEDCREELDEEEANEQIALRDSHRIKCEQVGIDFHLISCQVAKKWLKEQGVE